MRHIGNFVTAVEEFSFDGLQSFLRALIAHDITYIGQSYEDTGTILVAQATLDIEFLKKLRVDADTALHLVGELIDEVFFFLGCHGQ